MTPRTELTRELEKYNLQYFQWFYIERKSIKQVSNAFKKLFKDIALVTNEQHHFELKHWIGRRRAWKKRWNIPSNHRGPTVPVPDELKGSHLWRCGSSGTLHLPQESHCTTSTQNEGPQAAQTESINEDYNIVYSGIAQEYNEPYYQLPSAPFFSDHAINEYTNNYLGFAELPYSQMPEPSEIPFRPGQDSSSTQLPHPVSAIETSSNPDPNSVGAANWPSDEGLMFESAEFTNTPFAIRNQANYPSIANQTCPQYGQSSRP